MAEVSYALREDSSSIYLLEDAGQCYENYCQITVFARNLVRPEFFNQPLFFAPYLGHGGKYNGTITKLQMSMEDNDCLPKYDYVAVIESEVEFNIQPNAVHRLSRDYMPAWGMGSYLNYFSDRKSGILLFLRVYKTSHAVPLSFLEKGSKGSSQILKLYDEEENEVSLTVDRLIPVISDNKFSYLKDEIIHMLKVENVFITEYDSTENGLQKLRERVEADHLISGTHQRWENRHLQWLENEGLDDGDFDMAQLDYESIYNEVLVCCPAMKEIVNYIRPIQAARLGEYDLLLKDVHDGTSESRESELRIFDMSVRVALKNALYLYQKQGQDLEDAFQCACIGIIKAIRKHSESVEGLFPSYASSWMVQTLGREMPTYQYNFRLPVHYKDSLTLMIKQIEDAVGDVSFLTMDYDEAYHIIHHYVEPDNEKAAIMTRVLVPAASYESIMEEGDSDCLFSDKGQFMEELDQSFENELIQDSLNALTEREKSVITHRFGFEGLREKSLEEVGKMLGITRERVRQIESKAEWKILKSLKKAGAITRDEYNLLMNSKFQKFLQK